MNAHIIGIAGSGKTTLARWIAGTFDLTPYDLDAIAYGPHGERPPAEIQSRIDGILRGRRWVTEGVYVDSWVEPLLENASTIVWLDVPLYSCLFRMVKRHVFAELQRTNQHPGWIKLWRFLNYTRVSAADQRKEMKRRLSPHRAKVHRCSTPGDVAGLKAELLRSHAALP